MVIVAIVVPLLFSSLNPFSSFALSVQVQVMLVLLCAVPAKLLGAVGSAGVVTDTLLEYAELPALLYATTFLVYEVPLVRLVSV